MRDTKDHTDLTEFEREREKQITRLAKSLKQKIEEAIQVEEVNKNLREKLKEYQEQNEKNIELAQEEIKVISSELEDALINRRELEKQINSMQRELDELLAAKGFLEKDREELKEENAYLQEVALELQLLKNAEEKLELADRYYDRRLLEKYFVCLQDGIIRERRLEVITQKSRHRSDLTLKIVVFKALQRNAIIEKIIKYKQSDKQLDSIRRCFDDWALFAHTEKRRRFRNFNREADTLMDAFTCWRNYIDIKHRKRVI
jgi:cupin superfamily acireductone dioxygenase involved in methionine salvage